MCVGFLVCLLLRFFLFFFFNDTATTEIYTLSLTRRSSDLFWSLNPYIGCEFGCTYCYAHPNSRSEEHTSELQSHSDLVCRLLLEKKKKKRTIMATRQQRDFTAARTPYTHQTTPIANQGDDP